jgi:hypothetical protein
VRTALIPDSFSLSIAPFEAKIIAILTRQCTETLKLVRSVASQFRASTPTSSAKTVSSSYFIPNILKPLHVFFSARPTLSAKYRVLWSTGVLENVFGGYAVILASVRKTEDLLRRHRKSKKNTFSLFGGGSSSSVEGEGEEEERFKKQMEADVQGLRTDAESLGVQVESMVGWKELIEVVDKPLE